MEEHFRKSLGDDYSRVFKESEKKNESEIEVDPVKAFKDDLDMTGYTGKLCRKKFASMRNSKV